MPKMQEQFSAGAWMARIRETEQFSARWTTCNAENAGAIFGKCLDGANPRNGAILGQMDDVYAENAGAIFGRCLDGATTKNEAIADRVVGVMPKIHEHFSAMPSWLHE